MIRTVGIIGARGYVGSELIDLLTPHPGYEIIFVSSRSLAGQPVGADSGDLRYESLSPDEAAERAADVCVLALPNGLSGPFVEAIEETRPDTVIIDLSGDHRFDDDWYYGLPELTRTARSESNRIANPGCYATAMQLAIWPVRRHVRAKPVCFGVSGYSGAGTTKSPRNDPAALADNLMPYALTGHLHEREVSRQLGRQVWFAPQVAAFFRGISMTVVLQVNTDHAAARWRDLYADFYRDEPLIDVSAEIPQVRNVAGQHRAVVGGFSTDDDGRLVVVATLDNLLKGAATQALQNINLACNRDELEGIADGKAIMG